MKGQSNLSTKIKKNKITNSKRKRKEEEEEEESNEIDKDDKSDPKLIEFYKDFIDDSDRKSSLDTFVIFESVDNIYYLIYFNKKNSIIVYDLALNKKVNEIKNAHIKDIQKLKHYYDNYNRRNLVVSEDSKSNVKIWDIENLECICNLNFGEKDEKESNISSLCFLKDNIQINIAIKFIKNNFIRLFDLSGRRIKDIKGLMDKDYYKIESYF
jgi:WD40 repeat protein